jgi:HAD superfamily hydrolase (TIGR01509 family)
MIQAILFDFNGVIIDDEPIQMKAYKEVFAEREVELTEEGYLACLGMSDEVFARTIFERAGKPATAAEVLEVTTAKTAKWKTAVEKQIPIFEGVEDFIKRMHDSFTLGVVSMAFREEIDFALKAAGLDGYFDTVVSAEDVTTTKPDPACYREGFTRVDLANVAKGNSPMTRRQCVVIEDSPAGILAAKGARLKALGVTNTVAREALAEAGADAVTGNIKDWNAESFRRVF